MTRQLSRLTALQRLCRTASKHSSATLAKRPSARTRRRRLPSGGDWRRAEREVCGGPSRPTTCGRSVPRSILERERRLRRCRDAGSPGFAPPSAKFHGAGRRPIVRCSSSVVHGHGIAVSTRTHWTSLGPLGFTPLGLNSPRVDESGSAAIGSRARRGDCATTLFTQVARGERKFEHQRNAEWNQLLRPTYAGRDQTPMSAGSWQ